MSASKLQAPPRHSERLALGPGRWVSFRPIEPLDRRALCAFYANLSPESRRRRFLSAGATPSVGPLADAEGIVAILREPGPDDGALVAHASVQPDGTGSAEVAYAVADRLQRRGIGRALVSLTLDRVRALGLQRVDAALFADNGAMRHLLLQAGAPVLRDMIDVGVEELSLDLASPTRELRKQLERSQP
jgi:RimJ/RimL family protein N-acetyltransferase